VREGVNLEYTGVDEKIIFRSIFRKLNVGVRTGTRWLRESTSECG